MNAPISLEALGFSREELQERVVERAVQQLLTATAFDPEDDREWQVPSSMQRSIEAAIKTKVDERINAIAKQYVLPRVAEMVESISLQQTNKWGEKTGEPVTFIEYLVARADAYMREDVNHEGKGKTEANGYSWNKSQSRIAHLVDKHLHYSIETAMKSAMTVANSAIAGGIADTVKAKLAEVVAGLKVAVEVKR